VSFDGWHMSKVDLPIHCWESTLELMGWEGWRSEARVGMAFLAYGAALGLVL
jgi:hypothetical protein